MSNGRKTISDKSITDLLARDGRKALGLILEKYGDALYGVAWKVIPIREEAEDIIQEACIKIWQNGDKYDPGRGRLFTWLLNIVRNTAIDKIRTKKFQARKNSGSLDEPVTNSISFSEEMTMADPGLQKILQDLPEDQLRVIDFLYFKGYSQREAAKELDLSLSMIKSKGKSALRKLRKVLGDKMPVWAIATSLLIWLIMQGKL